MFGLDKDGNPTSDLMILDVADVNAISFLSTFPKANSSNTSNNSNGTALNGSNGPNTPNQGGRGLSMGAIIGIAVGCGVAGILAIIALIFFCRKRSKNNAQSSQNHAAEDDTNESPVLDVDWDRIDKQYYQEISPPNEHVQQRHSTTVVEERLSEPSITGTTTSVVTPDGTSTFKTSHIRLMQVVKPDGGN
ncbi:hypothetical protein MBANPS3_000728 [Mucor bainieri]